MLNYDGPLNDHPHESTGERSHDCYVGHPKPCKHNEIAEYPLCVLQLEGVSEGVSGCPKNRTGVHFGGRVVRRAGMTYVYNIYIYI